MNEGEIATIAHAIELAVAPVFLLAAVGAILNVMTIRLSRIIDRSRVLDGRRSAPAPDMEAIDGELRQLRRRGNLIHLAIALCTGCALMVCSVIGIVFLGAMFGFAVGNAVFSLFVAAMVSLISALVLFLREIQLAIALMQFRH